MPQTPPEWYLTKEELGRLRVLKAEIGAKKLRHAELMQQMKIAPHQG